MDNRSRKLRLIEFLPEEAKKSLVATIGVNVWQVISETAELTHGNSSVDVPKR